MRIAQLTFQSLPPQRPIGLVSSFRNAEEALDIAFRIAEKAKWHIEKLERMDCG